MTSDVHKVRSLQQAWFSDSTFADAVHTALDRLGFSEAYVDAAVDSDARSMAPRKDKVIKDSVWGMVEVDWQSTRLLDCPIIQRLRGVKQLGFTYFTYPSAEHSRFIHSLGMYAVVQRFLDAMGKNDGPSGLSGVKKFIVGANTRADLLHAAIMHDSGHMPFSHASEAIFSAFPHLFRCGQKSIDDFLFLVGEKLEKKLQLSECLSLVILLSPRFDTFYRRYVRPSGGDQYAVSRVAALVAGLMPDDNLRGPADLISTSPVDADKVDYITRDALACGIPVGIDVARLFLRSAFLTVSADRLRTLLPYENPTGEQVIFVVNASGVDTIEELAHARASLYQRVYLHQTTRNAERLLARCFEGLPEDSGGTKEHLRDALQLLAQDDSSLLRALNDHTNPEVKTLGTRLRNRALPKRACVLSRSLVDMHMSVDVFDGISQTTVSELYKQTLGASVQMLGNSKLQGGTLRNLEDLIRKEAASLAQLIGANRKDLVPREAEPSLVSVLPMTELKGLSKDCIVLENNELVHSSQRSISDEQSEASDIYKSLGYVLTDIEWREIVCLAARKIVAKYTEMPIRETSLRLLEETPPVEYLVNCQGRALIDLKGVWRRTGVLQERASELQIAAEWAGYYDEFPILAPCKDDEFNSIAQKVKGFSGQGKWEPRPKHCERFLSQFPPRLRAPFVEAFRGFQMLDRARITQYLLTAFDRFRHQIGDTSPIVIAALTPDSGNWVRMIFEQEAKQHLKERNAIFAKSISDALMTSRNNNHAVLLIDDNIGSGNQACAQFRAWFGKPRDNWPVAQQNEKGIAETPLSGEDQRTLSERPLGIGIGFGNQVANDALKAVLTENGVRNFTGLHLGEVYDHRPTLLPKDLSDFLHSVGADVLAYSRFGAVDGCAKLGPQERMSCEDDADGYGAAAWLVATPFNVPTSTYTALWCPGLFRGKPWLPLLIRRGHLNSLVIS